ncbi:MAG: EamA family transporter [Chloroflexota bacterium]
MQTNFLSIAFGLASAVSWGAGDFSGGFATKRGSVYVVVWLSQILGGLFLLTLALLFREPLPTTFDFLLGGVSGLAGVVGLLGLYRGLAEGRMGIVAPLTAVVAAAVPVIFGAVVEGLPAALQLVGFAFALVAVWFLSHTGDGGSIEAKELILPLVAGLGFGFFYILIDQVQPGAVFWPLVAARIASVSLLTIFIFGRGQYQSPERTQLGPIALSGLFDAGGNAFFVLAAQAGRLDIAAVLSSLYPVATVFLAWLILKERLARQQWIGVAAALIALVLIAL